MGKKTKQKKSGGDDTDRQAPEEREEDSREKGGKDEEASLEEVKAELPEGETPDLDRFSPDFLKKLLYEMLLVRRFEEQAAESYGLQKIGGFCHLYIGQEAVAVGAIAATDLKKDYVVTAYRDHGHALACGMEPKEVMAELFGKESGCSRGKGGSMHLFDAERHFLGGNGIVGAQIPFATGVGLRLRYREEDGVVLCFFGDGAIHQGVFHESLNLARIWDLPVVYICENNQYGMGTDYRRVSSVTDFSVMGSSYDIPGERVNGMDVLQVYEAAERAVKRAREERRATLIEYKTYRYKGHSMSDPAKYRTREELEGYREQDPILILQAILTESEIVAQDEIEEMDGEIQSTVDESVAFAEESEQPPLESIHEDVYA
jgi:pyruvate dehydrogenase E1 component alpha subunit